MHIQIQVPIRVEYRYTKSASWYIDIFALYHDTYRYVLPFLQVYLQSDLVYVYKWKYLKRIFSLSTCIWNNFFTIQWNIRSEDWLIDYLVFYVPLKNISLIWRRHHCRWRAAKFRPMLGAQGLWAGRDLYRATPAVTRDLGFSGLIRRTAPFSRLLQHMRGCGGSILTRILTGTYQCYKYMYTYF